MKKYILLFIIAALFISGCSSDENSVGSISSSVQGSNNFASKYDYGYDAETPARLMNESYGELTLTSSAQAVQRKITRNANMQIEAADVEQAYENIIKRLEELGGYEAGKTLEAWRDGVYIQAELKVPADGLALFLRGIADEGDVKSQNIYSSDITDQYYDSKTRLETLEKTLAKYYEFLDDAKTVKDQLEISNYISDLTYQIESLKGSINKWDFLVEYSSVSLYLYKTPEFIDTRVIEWSSLSFDDMGYLIKSGFVGVSSFIVNAFQLILVALTAGSPVIIPAAIIFIIVRRKIKKRRAGKPDDNKPEV